MALLNCFAELVQNKFLLDCICLFEGGEGRREGYKSRVAFVSRGKGRE